MKIFPELGSSHSSLGSPPDDERISLVEGAAEARAADLENLDVAGGGAGLEGGQEAFEIATLPVIGECGFIERVSFVVKLCNRLQMQDRGRLEAN